MVIIGYVNFQYYIKNNFIIDYVDYTNILATMTTLIFNST